MTSAEVPTKKCRVNLIGLNNYQASLEMNEEEAGHIINLFLDMNRRITVPLGEGWMMAFNFEHITSISVIVIEDD